MVLKCKGNFNMYISDMLGPMLGQWLAGQIHH